MSDGPNLFSRLHKWASRQDENFVTEALTVLLEQLLLDAPESGCRLIRGLTGSFLDVRADDAATIEIHTQVNLQRGRPDLEICTPHRLVWIEVKIESTLRAGQLAGYRVLMAESGYADTRLILLSRYPEYYAADDDVRPDGELRWFELAEMLETELTMIAAASSTAGYLARQFFEFLKERDMTLTQVNKMMPEGTRALGHLMTMLNEAAAANKVSAKISVGWDYYGLTLDGTRYWIGINFSEPDKVWFGTRAEINVDAARRLGVGKIEEESWVPGRYRWWRSIELESEEVHFFQRTKVGQMRFLEQFLRECLATARSIEVPDQPPPPDEQDSE